MKNICTKKVMTYLTDITDCNCNADYDVNNHIIKSIGFFVRDDKAGNTDTFRGE